jgi:hypothetical protein
MTTARWIHFEEFKCDLTYTIEISYGGFDKVTSSAIFFRIFRDSDRSTLMTYRSLLKISSAAFFSSTRETNMSGILSCRNSSTKIQSKITRTKAIEKLQSNLDYYMGLNKNGGDHSDTDSDISLENVEIEEFAEKKPKEHPK